MSARSQEAAPNGQRTEVINFNRFLNNHPQIARELANNPTLLHDSDFLAHNPPLKQFLDTHPGVSANVRNAPGSIANHDGQFEWTPAAPITGEGGRFYSGYLYDHPEVAHQIAANPALLDSPEYVAAHPGLQEYINSHPDVARK